MYLSLLCSASSVCVVLKCCEKRKETNILKELLLKESVLILTVGTVWLNGLMKLSICPNCNSVFICVYK